MLTLDALYTVFKSAVRFSNRENWLQTFAVIQGMPDLNAPNLNKVVEDYNKPYFFSRRWERSGYNTSDISFDYPGLFIIETARSYKFKFDQPPIVTVDLEISVLDRFIEGRLIPEIERDTSVMLMQVMDYLKYVNAYSDGTTTYYLHEDHAAWIIDKGTTLTKLIPETTSYQDSVNRLYVSNSKGFYLSLGSDDLHGSFIETSFLEYGDCSYPEPEWYAYDDYLKDLSCGC
jgi:hypothetical protein